MSTKNTQDIHPFVKWRLKRSVRAADDARSKADWQNAYAYYSAALRLSPTAASIWVQVGHAAKEMGDFDNAARAYTTADQLQPSDIDVKIQFGHLLKEMGRRAEAITYYKAAIAAGSSDIHAIDFLVRDAVAQADALRENGEFASAAVVYRKATDLRTDFGVLMQMAHCLKSVGKIDDAKQAYLSALALEPNNADCRLQIEQLLTAAGGADSSRMDAVTNVSPQAAPCPPAIEHVRAAIPVRRNRSVDMPENAAIILEKIRYLKAKRLS